MTRVSRVEYLLETLKLTRRRKRWSNMKERKEQEEDMKKGMAVCGHASPGHLVKFHNRATREGKASCYYVRRNLE